MRQVKRCVSVLLADNLAKQISQEADISAQLAQTLVHMGPFDSLSHGKRAEVGGFALSCHTLGPLTLSRRVREQKLI